MKSLFLIIAVALIIYYVFIKLDVFAIGAKIQGSYGPGTGA
jgi:hypothetical protein